MEITSKLLLSSAQSFIQKKEIENNTDRKEIKTTQPHADSQQKKILYDKLIKSAEHLKNIQYEYTKEQMRLYYINESQPALDIKFGNEPLFPELATQKEVKIEDLKSKILQNLEKLKYKLKQQEIEQENFFAANFTSPENLNIQDLKRNLTNIDPLRVTKLTRYDFLG